MKKQEWRKTTKVRMRDSYIRYEYCFIIAILAILCQSVFVIGTLTDVYGYGSWEIFNYLAAALAISIYWMIFTSPTPREIYARVQCPVFYLESFNFGGLERKRATATLIQYKKSAYLITNAYAILNDEKKPYENIECGLMAESLLREIFRQVELIKYDNDLDIAILKFKESKKELNPYIQPLKWKTVRKLKGGDKVYLIGNAQGQGVGISQGMISLPLTYEETYRNYYIQSTVNSAYGMSGGALLDKRGRLVGIHKWSDIETHNFHFAIPIDQIIEFIEEIKLNIS